MASIYSITDSQFLDHTNESNNMVMSYFDACGQVVDERLTVQE